MSKFQNLLKNHPFFMVYSKIVLNLRKSFSDQRINAMGAELAYYSVVAFFTLGVGVVYASGLMPAVSNGAIFAIENLLPEAVSAILVSIIAEISLPKQIFPLFITGFMSIWFSSRAIRSMMSSFDSIYQLEKKRKPIQITYQSIIFTLVFEFLFISIFTFLVLGKTISTKILDPLNMTGQLRMIFHFVRVFFPTILMLFTFWVFYASLTSKKIKFRSAFPGALFTTVLWFIISKIFSLYFNEISNFPVVLGSAGGIFVFLIWIYWCSIIILVGAILNYRFSLLRDYQVNKKNLSLIS